MKTLREAVSEFREEYIVQAVVQCNGNQRVAAGFLGVHRNTVWRVMKKHGLRVKELHRLARRAHPRYVMGKL